MIITIGGSIASGKTTLAREIAKRFGMKHISAGGIMRDMAKERGMSLLEFSKYAEEDQAIDKEIDVRQKTMCESGDCVVDGRLSAYFLPADLRIWLDAPLDIRVGRAAKRDRLSPEKAGEAVLRREGSEKKRYREIYGIDLDDRMVYDLVVNTKNFDVEEMVEIVSAAVKVFNAV